jgi:hypothetical protein
MESLTHQLHVEHAKRSIRNAEPEDLSGLKSLALMLLEKWSEAHGFSARAAWKLGEMEREIGDLRRTVVELQSSGISFGARPALRRAERT